MLLAHPLVTSHQILPVCWKLTPVIAQVRARLQFAYAASAGAECHKLHACACRQFDRLQLAYNAVCKEKSVQKNPPCMRMQAVGRDAVTPDNHSGFWHQRYTLRGAASSGDSVRQSRSPGAEGTARHIPVFLENLQGTILTTGRPSVPRHHSCYRSG